MQKLQRDFVSLVQKQDEKMITSRLIFISLLTVVAVSCIRTVRACCTFPAFALTRPNNNGEILRDWRSHVTSAHSQGSQQIVFDNSTMTVYTIGVDLGRSGRDERPRVISRECLIEASEGQYILRQRGSDSGDEPARETFICLEILRRGDDVLQLKYSEESSEKSIKLCDDEGTRLDEWLLINRANLYQSYSPCPLNGGYDIKIFDNRHRVEVCASYDGETRLESECFPSEGLHFRFRYDTCVPKNVHMSREQRLFCMASWSEGSYHYVALRHDKADHLWCLRYPRHSEPKRFRAHLFEDFFCSTERIPSRRKYLSIDMTRSDIEEAHQKTSNNHLCYDDYEACSWGDPCVSAPDPTRRLACAKKCGVCNETRPSVCTIPSLFRGNWTENTSSGKEQLVEIDSTSIFLHGSDTHLRCVEWGEYPTHAPLSSEHVELLLATTFTNGCRPRYFCIQLKKFTPSVLRLRRSESQTWPFSGNNDGEVRIDCSSFKYTKDYASESIPEPYGGHRLKLLISSNDSRHVPCHFGESDRSKYFEARFSDGKHCSVRLTRMEVASKSRIILSGEGSESCGETEKFEHRFACLESRRHHGNVNILFTEMINRPSRNFNQTYMCWLQPASLKLTVYLLPPYHCHDEAASLVTQGVISPIAVLREQHPQPAILPSSYLIADVHWKGHLQATDTPTIADESRHLVLVNREGEIVEDGDQSKYEVRDTYRDGKTKGKSFILRNNGLVKMESRASKVSHCLVWLLLFRAAFVTMLFITK